MPTLAELLQGAAASGLARIDAQLLLLHSCGRDGLDRAWLLAHDQEEVTSLQESTWRHAMQRRLAGEPVAYITGYKEFYSLRLKITPDVLDPRDDTETLVDWALELIPVDHPFKVLDLGTGSGAIALAIQSQRPLAQVIATDASAAALNLAQTNAASLKLAVRFVLANVQNTDWFSCLGDERFDLIVSNPPYIAEGDLHLPALKHEPALALTSGSDGLDAIRSITATAPKHLHPGGWLLLEHGYDQAGAVHQLLACEGFEGIACRQDLGGVDRCTAAMWR
jgi:release factor glutamine methyltransferase